MWVVYVPIEWFKSKPIWFHVLYEGRFDFSGFTGNVWMVPNTVDPMED